MASRLSELSDAAPALPAVVRSVGAAALLDAESAGGAYPRARVRTRSGTPRTAHGGRRPTDPQAAPAESFGPASPV